MDRDLLVSVVRDVVEGVLASEFRSLRLQLDLRDRATHEWLRHIVEKLEPEVEIRERLAVLEDRLGKR